MKNIKKILLCSTLAFILGFAAIANVNAETKKAEPIVSETFGGGSWIAGDAEEDLNEEGSCDAGYEKIRYLENGKVTEKCFKSRDGNPIISLGTFSYQTYYSLVENIDCYTPFDVDGNGKITRDDAMIILQTYVGKVPYTKYPSLVKYVGDFGEEKIEASLALQALQLSIGTLQNTEEGVYICHIKLLKNQETGNWMVPQLYLNYSSNQVKLNMPSTVAAGTTKSETAETQIEKDKFAGNKIEPEDNKVKIELKATEKEAELFVTGISASTYNKVLTTQVAVTYATVKDLEDLENNYALNKDGYLWINGMNTGLKICDKENKDDCLGVFVGDDGYLYIMGKRVADLTKDAASKIEWKDDCLYIDDESKFCKGDTGTTSNPKTGVATSIILAGTVVIAVTVGTTIVLKRKYMKNI